MCTFLPNSCSPHPVAVPALDVTQGSGVWSMDATGSVCAGRQQRLIGDGHISTYWLCTSRWAAAAPTPPQEQVLVPNNFTANTMELRLSACLIYCTCDFVSILTRAPRSHPHLSRPVLWALIPLYYFKVDITTMLTILTHVHLMQRPGLPCCLHAGRALRQRQARILI